jgi:NTP pyrophosphatase (non-canonical NTP hydrolase)
MNADEYQRAARSTSYPYMEAARDISRDPVLAEAVICKMYTALGLGESGEAQEVTKKHVRSMRHKATPYHTLTHEEAREKKLSELGDILWYVANDAAEWDLTLAEVMEFNVAKLQARVARGTLAAEDRTRHP